MPFSRKSELPIVLPSLLSLLANERQDVTHLAGLTAKDLKEQDVPRVDLVWLGNQMYERQKQGRKLDPSDPDYSAQILALEDEAGFFRLLFGCWWADWDPFDFEQQLDRAKS